MKSPAAFSGNYANIVLVKTRSVAAIHVEIPIEQAAEFIKAFGIPNPATEIPVALALLNVEAVDKPIRLREHKSFEDCPPAQQAALIGKEPKFWKYLIEEHDRFCGSAVDAANHIRILCGVDSRADIKPNTHAHEMWKWLCSGYMAWQEAERCGA